MQSFLAFCSICLQLSSLQNQNNQIMLKRDEACTLCLAGLLQPETGKSYNSILNDGLYFNNPLLQEALKSKLEQQFLYQENHEVPTKQEPSKSEEPTNQVLDNRIKEFVQVLEQIQKKASSYHNKAQQELETQKESLFKTIKNKIELANIRLHNSKLERANKLTLPTELYYLDSTILEIESVAQKMTRDLADKKLHELAGKLSQEIQHLSQKILRLKKISAKTQSLDTSSLQEISSLITRISTSLEDQSALRFQFDHRAILDSLDENLNQVSDLLQNYIKPIKTGIKAGEILPTHGHFTSENRIFNLVMQKDNNLVLYKITTPVWSSKTYRDDWTGLQPQLVLNKEEGTLQIKTAVSTNTLFDRHPQMLEDPYLTVTNAGTVKLMNSGNTLWSPQNEVYPPKSSFQLGEQFSPEDFIVSENDIYTLILQNDYNLVLYEHSNPIWNSGTFDLDNNHKYKIKLTDQGSLVLQNHNGSSKFLIVPPHPSYQGKTSLSVTNDGAIIINGKNMELWNSKK